MFKLFRQRKGHNIKKNKEGIKWRNFNVLMPFIFFLSKMQLASPVLGPCEREPPPQFLLG